MLHNKINSLPTKSQLHTLLCTVITESYFQLRIMQVNNCMRWTVRLVIISYYDTIILFHYRNKIMIRNRWT